MKKDLEWREVVGSVGTKEWDEMSDADRVSETRAGNVGICFLEDCLLNGSEELQKLSREAIENSTVHKKWGALQTFKTLFDSETETVSVEMWQQLSFEKRAAAVRSIKINWMQFLESRQSDDKTLYEAGDGLFGLMCTLKDTVKNANESELDSTRGRVRELMVQPAQREQMRMEYYKEEYQKLHGSILADISKFATELGITFDESKIIQHGADSVTYEFENNSELLALIDGIRPTHSRADDTQFLIGIRDILRDEVNRQKQAKEQKSKRKRQTQKLTPLDSEPYMYMASDKATKFFINSLMPNQTQPIKEAKLDALEARGISIPPRLMAVCVKDDDPKFAGLVSYNTGLGESVFRFFQEKSALAVKAHFALWARAHRETKAEPGKLVKMTISQFCDDLGFQKKKRAHTRENKQHALQILETLTSAEMILLWQDPQKKLRRTKGNVWQRGLSDEVFDTHINGTNGQNENLIPGTEKFWDPKTFSYSPGGFFTDPDWRKFNKHVGFVGQGLLKLGANNKDKAAVLIGGYIAFLARIENYTRDPLKLTTLIENTGDLLTGYIDRREATMLETIVENALDRLTDVKVIKGYEWVYEESLEPSDSAQKIRMPELLARRIQLFFPDELAQLGKEYKELETAHRKKAATKKAKAEQAKAKRK